MADLSYYAMYLKNHLKEVGDPRSADDDFITGRAGYSVDGAQELAMTVLLGG